MVDGRVRTWLAECYSPGIARADVAAAEARAREAATALGRDGVAVAYLGALLVAEDEVVFHAFTAGDAPTVREAGLRAGIVIDRVVEAESVPPSSFEDLLGALLGRDAQA